ncbi:uncharacterized protein LOC114962353 isoform X3 [Acropora millepora]|uniref:uncharacterized protein LOC114962353 isoform X3 n=1 Tax=Acropora millepora TaxID=45264 RepID=UPI001CF2E8C9|nr:uncharacterized protein LOC114962353 isoform X3 [Acropora millepora]
MLLIVLSLSLLCFTVYVNSQGCVGEDLDCNKAVPTVFKLSDASCPCNAASHAGALKFANNEVYVCSGKEWKIISLTGVVGGPYGSEGNPGLSCDDIYDKRIRDGRLEDGIYWMRISSMFGSGKQEAFPVYCDMKHKGWTMVFKAMSGIARSSWSVYSSTYTSNEFEKKALDVTNDVRKHYKNRIVLFWESFDPAQARVTFHKGGSVRKALTFDAQNSNFGSWFRHGKLTGSSWDDLSTFKGIGTFSLKGYCSSTTGICQNILVTKRIFAITPTCDQAYGWIYTGTYDYCFWEKESLNDIVYCNKKQICHFEKKE